MLSKERHQTATGPDRRDGYSPNLNPIEMAFSKLKAHLRRIGARTFTDMFNALAEICDLFSPEECWSYFKAAGYVSG
jgi:transposase